MAAVSAEQAGWVSSVITRALPRVGALTVPSIAPVETELSATGSRETVLAGMDGQAMTARLSAKTGSLEQIASSGAHAPIMRRALDSMVAAVADRAGRA